MTQQTPQPGEPNVAAEPVRRPVRPAKPMRRRRRLHPILIFVLIFTLFEGVVVFWNLRKSPEVTVAPQATATPVPPRPGDIVAQDSVQHFTPAEANTLIRRNYPGGMPTPPPGITKVIFHYRSELPGGKPITVYGRAYVPDDARTDLPVFAFAPGTTGIDDKCAASLEKPAVANWANYDSHMAAYASQGYVAVTTDYEGMRDPDRIHHYMVGELEGRALLDAVRAVRQLPQSQKRVGSDVFLGGYSQGGHAAFWADKIADRYAPDIQPKGVVGFGPVMSVKQTLTDVTRAANINWFGPNVVLSYQDYYGKKFPGVILPAREANLAGSVLAHCIDTNLPFWGYTPAGVYTPEFIQAASTGTLNAKYPEFGAALDKNTVGAVSTESAKRINQGDHDNVVLPAQQDVAVPLLCGSSQGPVQYVKYLNTTHYDTMLHSFAETLGWMSSLSRGEKPATSCQ